MIVSLLPVRDQIHLTVSAAAKEGAEVGFGSAFA